MEIDGDLTHLDGENGASDDQRQDQKREKVSEKRHQRIALSFTLDGIKIFIFQLRGGFVQKVQFVFRQVSLGLFP